MTTFDKREEAFERKFAHDEELKFRATARRNRLLGQWAAGLLGKSGADVDAHVKEGTATDPCSGTPSAASRQRRRPRGRWSAPSPGAVRGPSSSGASAIA